MRRLAACLSAVCMLLLSGCGGGGSAGFAGTTGGTGGGTTGASPHQANVSATFTVDVNTGKVKIVNYSRPLAGKLFNGNAISFNSSLLTDLPGDVGTKVLNVSITNNSGTDIGSLPNGNVTGFKVIFGPMYNLTGIANVAAQTTVTTFAGSTVGFQDGPLLNSKFTVPGGIASDPAGNLYVADYGNQRVRKLSAGRVTTVAGNGTAGITNGNGTGATFAGPTGIAYNPLDGSLVVTDYSGDMIRRVTVAGQVSTIAGTGSTGEANGSGSSATFTTPAGAAVDSNGIIYVADDSANVIRKIVFNGGDPTKSANYTVSTFAGTGAGGYLDGPGTTAQFTNPRQIVCDSANNVVVADSGNNVIRRIDSIGNVSTIAGTGASGSTDGFGNVATFISPTSVAIVGNSIVVTDTGSDKIRQLTPIDGIGATPSAWTVATLAGNGSAGSTNGVGYVANFSTLYSVCATGTGSIYVLDSNIVRKLTSNTGFFPIGVSTGSTSGESVQLSNIDGVIPGSGLGAFMPYIAYNEAVPNLASSSAHRWAFTVPHGVTSFQFNVVVEASTDALILPQGATGVGSPYVDVSTFAGNPNRPGYLNGFAGEAQFSSFLHEAMDAQGVMYVSDDQNGAIRRIGTDGLVSTIAGTVRTGLGAAIDGTGDVARFFSPTGIVVNQAGNEIFVADYTDNDIRRIAFSGGDPTNPANWTVTTIAGGASSAGFADGSGSVALFNQPWGMAMTQGGTIYVGESGGNRVRRLTYQGGDRGLQTNWIVTTVAGDTSGAAGASGFVNAQGTAARFHLPEGVACDKQGDILVADTQNNVIRMIDPGGNVTTYAGTGASGDQDGAAATATFKFPVDVCMDSAGYLYTGALADKLIRRISPSRVVETIAGVANSGGHQDGPGNSAKFNQIEGIMITPSGELFAGDSSCIRLVQRVLGTSVNKR